MKRTVKRLVLACAVGLALAGVATAQSDAPTPAQQKELDAARAELDRAAKHYAELTREYNAPGVAPMIMTYGKQTVRRPVLGVLLAPDPQAGVRIAGVTPDSAAAAGGLKSGDRLVGIDGKALKAASGSARVDEARELLDAADTKTPTKLSYERDGKTRVVALTPKDGDRMILVDTGENRLSLIGSPEFKIGPDGEVEASARQMRMYIARDGIAPDVRTEIIRLGSDCKGKDCKLPVLAEAFRWNGLNLASLDAQLGRYFGTDKGVLVLSPGPQLGQLQAGDVILGIDGKPVATPRDAMDALRARKQGDKASLTLLRDHHEASAQVTVPKAMPLPIPPAPPAPPAPPPAPKLGDVPAPPAPPAPPNGNPPAPLAPPAPPPPPPPER